MPRHAGGRSALGLRSYHRANRTFHGGIKILEIDYRELAKSGLFSVAHCIPTAYFYWPSVLRATRAPGMPTV